MIKINSNYLKLPGSYLFSDIAGKVAAYTAAHPEREIIKLGIGDVTQPLPPAVVASLHEAVEEMGAAETFHGYGPEQGYAFLRESIVENDYKARGVEIEADEIFVSDGSKSDTGNIGDIFAAENKVAVCDPVYPVYADTNAMAGRAGDYLPGAGKWTNLIYLPGTEQNHFIPEPPSGGETPDLIYLCYPNNPTGTMISKEALRRWVDYALAHQSVILYDAAYEAYITEEGLPHSIYEIEGAKRCAIEFRSFSKNAGFTGTRCAFTVVPKSLAVQGTQLHALWNRRQTTKFNGVPYIVQKAAAAVYSAAGKMQTEKLVSYYLQNARVIRESLQKAGYKVWGGVNAPYVWLKTPENMSSWQFFDYLLEHLGVVGTPGCGFGPGGEGYFRLTGFGSAENTERAVERIVKGSL